MNRNIQSTPVHLEEAFATADIETAEIAFGELLKIYGHQVRSFLKSVTSVDGADEDIYAEACLSLWRQRSQFPESGRSFKGFFFFLARQRHTDWLRAAGPRRRSGTSRPQHEDLSSALSIAAPSGLQPYDQFLLKEQQKLFEEWMYTLSPKDAVMISLHSSEERLHGEIAQALDLTVDQVRYRIKTLTESLRRFLSEFGY